MRTLLIADLHLSEHTPEITQGFVDYVSTTASGAEALYILGDLFDAWIGDDLLTFPHPMAEVATRVTKALAALAESGTAVYLMHGNRDFLIGERFINACKASLLPDVQESELHGIPVVLMHGDSLCTGDEAYMAFRQQSRDPQWQAQMLALPLEQRLELAKSLRQQSDSANAGKADDIMDVTSSEVIRVMAEHGVTTLIHGHTHRPKVHDMMVEDIPAKRYVLGDWDARHGWDIVIEEGARTPQLRQFDITRLPQA
ncbi:UDP-2,3-diacylglucosamine diphosphatase [Halomonas sp. TBZ9]|uniref:UDP-2,3-diacylglucosamine hydrolase n=1 Tax=Vreelandella azerica TaxID=2732867 RepID=A0A7Y3XAA5_9GAMM|nr:UDP-2,3-diacylglucosamine diphosphatase [Halomonas azerica]NOG31096.1 UDP-2,3-diacylglucosamine diphosphatase [Halomonas azerica]